jgi:hypothetical protein
MIIIFRLPHYIFWVDRRQGNFSRRRTSRMF